MAEALEPVRDRYDFVVLDASPGVDAIAVNVLACADEIVAPVALTPAAMAGVLEFERHVERVARHNPALHLKYFLPTFLDRRTRHSQEMLLSLQERFGERVCPAIRVNVELAESFGLHQTIFEFAPRSRGALDYEAFAELVMTGKIAGEARPAELLPA